MTQFTLLLLLALDLTRVKWQSLPVVLALGLFLVFSRIFSGKKKPSWASSIFGLCVPLFPMLDSEGLSALAVFFLLSSSKLSLLKKNCNFASYFIAVVGTWFFAEIYFNFDYAGVGQIWSEQTGGFLAKLQAVLDYLRLAPQGCILAAQSFSRILILIFSFLLFREDQKERSRFCDGLYLGVLVSTLLCLIQIFGLLPEIFPNQNSFWSFLRRPVGTFSDPNAFGVFALLCLPFFLIYSKNRSQNFKLTAYLLCSVWLVLGALSGSRSFVAGVALYLLIYLYQIKRTGFYALIFSMLGLILALNLSPALNQLLSAHAPLGLERVLNTLSSSHMADELNSRFVFIRAGIQIFYDNWILGVGFGNFRSVFPDYAKLLKLGTGTWSDNPNNFYLGVLAELGVLGFLALLVLIVNLRWQSQSTLLERLPILSMLFLLFLGPHLEFTEVSLIFALLMSFCLNPRDLDFSPAAQLFSSAVFTSIVALKVFYSPSGMFGIERTQSGELFRWSTQRFRVLLPCDSNGQAELKYRILKIDSPIQIFFSNPIFGEVTRELAKPGSFSAHFSCLAQNQYFKTLTAPQNILVRVSMNHGWLPKNSGLPADPRPLGVQIFQ